MAAPKRIQNTVLGVAIVVELIVLAGHPLFGWGRSPRRFAATPPTLAVTPATPPSAPDVLLGLSGAAAHAATRSARHTGRYAYVQRETWQLSDQQIPGPRAPHPLIRTVTTWRAADGAGRALVVQRTRSGAARALTTTLTATAPLPTLTGSGAALDRRLGLRAGASTQTAIQTFAALAAQQPIPPAAEAEILRLLAGDAGLVDAGTTRDRAGQAGIAIDFSAPVDGTTIRDTLVFDARTGALLEYDQALAGGGPRHLDVPSGALLSYTLYLASGRVDALGVRPAPR